MAYKIYTNVVPFYEDGTRVIDVFTGQDALDRCYEDYDGPNAPDVVVFCKVRSGEKHWELPKSRTGYKWQFSHYLLNDRRGWRYIEVRKKRRNRK